MCLVGQLPCGSVLTPAISCTKLKIRSAHADSPMTKAFNSLFVRFFREDQSLLHRPRNSGRECAWWTNSLVGQFLHQLHVSLLQSSRSVQCMETVPWSNNLIISFLRFFRVDQSLLHRPRNSGRECAWWTNSLVGQFLHQLSLVQSSRSIQRLYLIKIFLLCLQLL